MKRLFLVCFFLLGSANFLFGHKMAEGGNDWYSDIGLYSGDYVSMDRIVGRNPETGEVDPMLKEVSKEEYEMIKAKELNKKAYKRAEEARMKLERAKQSGDEAKIKEAERKLEEANRDVELSKAKIEDLKAKQIEEKTKAQNLDSNVSKK